MRLSEDVIRYMTVKQEGPLPTPRPTNKNTSQSENEDNPDPKNEINLLPYGDYFWRSLNSKTIVYDLIYNPAPTHLLKFSANKGCMTLDGLQMLVAQGIKSLSFWTDGLEVPFHIMNDALKNYLKKNDANF